DIFQQTDRPDHFAGFESWKDQASLDAHESAAATKQFRAGIAPVSVAYYDQRVLRTIDVAERRPAASPAFAVLIHIDSPGAGRDKAVALMNQLATDARKETGNVAFDIVQQPSNLNHFTVLELWADRKAYEAHRVAPSTRQFRE